MQKSVLQIPSVFNPASRNQNPNIYTQDLGYWWSAQFYSKSEKKLKMTMIDLIILSNCKILLFPSPTPSVFAYMNRNSLDLGSKDLVFLPLGI